nr:hypothetical protein [Tanacetum cinerariifolium]
TYYAYASGAKEPKKARKFKKPISPKSKTILISPKEPTKKPRNVKKDVISTKKPTTKPKPTKKKASIKADRGKGLNVLSKVALSEAVQLKEVPDEQQRKISSTNKGTGSKPGVQMYDSESEKESWGDSGEE